MSSWDILSDFRRLMIQQEPYHLNKRLNEMRAATVFFDTKLVLAAWWWWWWNQFEWRVAVKCIVSVTARSELTMANCYPAQLSSVSAPDLTPPGWSHTTLHSTHRQLHPTQCVAQLSSAQLWDSEHSLNSKQDTDAADYSGDQEKLFDQRHFDTWNFHTFWCIFDNFAVTTHSCC